MDSRQIHVILSQNSWTHKCFKGVFASDKIPAKFTSYPLCFVANTDRAHSRGTHWLAFYARSANSIEYFDSFGEEPNPDIVAFLEKFKRVKVSRVKLQAIWDVSCGPYTIYFLINRLRGRTFEEIVKSLQNPLSDVIVKYFLYKLRKI